MPPRFEDVFTGKPIAYAIHEDSIRACDPSKLIYTFDVTRIHATGKLHLLRGALALSVRGWDKDPRAIHEIPEVRTYVQELDRQYPYLVYVCTPLTETLRLFSLCLHPASTTQRRADDPEQFKTRYETSPYYEILQRWMRIFDETCALARHFTRVEHARMTIELAEYFGVEWEPKSPR